MIKKFENFDFNDDDFDFEEEDEVNDVIFDRSELTHHSKNLCDLVPGNLYDFKGSKVCYIGKGEDSEYPVICVILKSGRFINWIPTIPLEPLHITIKGYMSSSDKIKDRITNILLIILLNFYLIKKI